MNRGGLNTLSFGDALIVGWLIGYAEAIEKCHVIRDTLFFGAGSGGARAESEEEAEGGAVERTAPPGGREGTGAGGALPEVAEE